MPLFTVPKRAGSKALDSKIAKKSKTATKAISTVRGGSNLLAKITEIKMMVDKYLGKYADDYVVIRDEITLNRYIAAALNNGVISIDTETTGLDPLQDDVVGVCLYTPGQQAAYIPINHKSSKTGVRVPDQLTEKQVAASMQALITHHIKDIIMFNAKFDIRVLRHMGLHDIFCTWDCYLAGRLLNENEESGGLKYLYKKYCLQGQGDSYSFEALFKGVPFDLIPIPTAYLYAARDAVMTYDLWQYQKKYLRLDSEREDIRNIAWVFHNIEMPCVPVVADMEDTGVAFDMEYQTVLQEKYNKLLQEKMDNFYHVCDSFGTELDKYREKQGAANKLEYPINISSPSQIAIMLYDVLGVKSPDKKNLRGTGEDILKKIDHPVARAIVEYREVKKLLSTYIEKLPDCVNSNDGRIHCSFNQYGANTGRFSSSDPNLQNIPSHNKDIRKMFVATNRQYDVNAVDDEFCVGRWQEVETVGGWKYAHDIKKTDKLLVDMEGVRKAISILSIQPQDDYIYFRV